MLLKNASMMLMYYSLFQNCFGVKERIKNAGNGSIERYIQTCNNLYFIIFELNI